MFATSQLMLSASCENELGENNFGILKLSKNAHDQNMMARTRMQKLFP